MSVLPAQAQQELFHAKLATTEAHYLQRQTRGPDVRAVLEQIRRWRLWRLIFAA